MADQQVHMRVWRGDAEGGEFRDYRIAVGEGMVVLDVIHAIQAQQANDLAVRWNCKAGKCGSCSAEVNGKPRLMCMTRMNLFQPGETITVSPMRTFPIIRDLVTDVSFNFKKARDVPAFKPKPKEPDGTRRMYQEDIDRVQEFHKCIECFLCQNVCHVIRDHDDNKAGLCRAAPFRALSGARDASPRYQRSDGIDQAKSGDRILQYYQMLHRGVSGAHSHHRQCDHSIERKNR